MKTEEELNDFLSKNSSDVQNVCRICLCTDSCNSVPIFNGENADVSDDILYQTTPKPETTLALWEKFIICGRVRARMDDKLPKTICKPCYYDLDMAHLFRIKCQKADAVLRKVLEDASIKSEESLEKKCEINILEITQIKEENDVDDFDAFFDDAAYDSHHTGVRKKKKRKQSNNGELSKLKKSRGNESVAIETEFKLEPGNDDNIVCEELGDKKFICEICNKCVKTKYILAKHIQVLHGEMRSFRTKKPEIGPVTGHGAERRFHCPECEYKCRRRQTLQYHMSTHTGEKPFKCDECPRSFAQHASLYTHKKTHSDKTYYTCQECGRQFKHYGIFKNHRKVHSNELNFICTICSKAMKSQKTLNDHMNRHLQIKQYSCEYCGRSFVTQSCLILHLRVHDKTKERKYKCTFCEFSCHSKGALDVHIKRHTGVRNFPCESCNHMCYTRGELKTHSRKHTKEQNYACPLCDMKFRHSPSLNKHMLKKHGEKFKWSSTVDRRIVK